MMNTSDTALLMVDIQNDFCAGGALAVPDGSDIVPVVNALQPKFPVRVLTQDWHPGDHRSFASNHPDAVTFSVVRMPYGDQVLWPDHCVQGSPGAQFHPDLETDPADLIVRKGFRPAIDSYSAFFENDKSTPTGLATDFCVAYSALDAARLGFRVTVIEDACRGIDLDGSLAAAISDMKANGIAFVTSEALV